MNHEIDDVIQVDVLRSFCIQGQIRNELGPGTYTTKSGAFRCFAPEDAEISEAKIPEVVGETIVLETESDFIALNNVEVEMFWHDGPVVLFCTDREADVYVKGLSPWD